ncbi:MAG TPA: protein-glutamate O-methyltransferase CheR, partial [Actinomycetota bacterium]
MADPAPTGGLSQLVYARFRDLVRDVSGLEFNDARRGDLDRAVSRALVETNAPDPDSLYRRLTADGGDGSLLESFIATLTIGETYFFRNRAQFEALEQHVLPDLIDRRADSHRLRIWSAGCSTGEEAYSMAILLDRLVPDRSRWHITLLATDINRGALEKAHHGVYGPWSFRDVDPEIQAGYFSRRDREYRVHPRIRSMVSFACLNLVEDAYPSLLTNTQGMDLILCRNVLIYFRQETLDGVVARLRKSLVPEGWFVPGHAEASNPAFRDFESVAYPHTVVFRNRSWFALGRTAAGEASRMPAFPAAPAPPPPASTPVRTSMPAPEPTLRDAPASDDVPGPASALHADAMSLWEAERSPDALRRLAALAEADDHDAWAPYLCAKICANELRLEHALGWIRRSVDRDPTLAPAHYLHGLILTELGEM